MAKIPSATIGTLHTRPANLIPNVPLAKDSDSDRRRGSPSLWRIHWFCRSAAERESPEGYL